MKQVYAYVLYCLFLFGIACSMSSAQEDWMPDTNLRQAVREKLNLPQNTPLTVWHLEHLYDLVVLESNISNLHGLEHAVNLRFLHLSIRLSEQAVGVESGLRNTTHTVPDLDGEIYLKRTTDRHDVNEDGVVKILDLVAVAGGFMKHYKTPRETSEILGISIDRLRVLDWRSRCEPRRLQSHQVIRRSSYG